MTFIQGIIIVVCLIGYKLFEGMINLDMVTPATGAGRHFVNFLYWLALCLLALLINYLIQTNWRLLWELF